MDMSSFDGTRVLFATPECAPLTKTGGLGDVSAALPAALRALGLDVRVLLPGYRPVLEGLRPCSEEIAVLGKSARLLEGRLPSGVPLYVLDCPELYVRDGGPYQDPHAHDWPDNPLRFGVFCKAAALLAGGASPLDWKPDVLHSQDWPAALAAVFLTLEPARAASVLTVHNLAFQGNFDPAWVSRLGLPPEWFSVQTLEFHGRMSFLKGGLASADAITTVSPRYAREILGEEHGCGLDGLLRSRAGALTGIVNGIDTVLWNPECDPLIASRYDAATLDAKRANKAALQQRLGLPLEPELPLLGTVGRLTHQKGSDLIADAAEALVETPAQLVVLGTGDRAIEQALRAAAARLPGRMAVAFGFEEALAHLIEAGSDVFLMPSRYEPCGLNQMYSQRYGTPPVARATGGLADTIADGASGFLFERAEPAALVAAVRRAAALWRDPQRWRALQRRAMARDFSWAEPARRYADLYLRLATARA
jgi:starch synthase